MAQRRARSSPIKRSSSKPPSKVAKSRASKRIDTVREADEFSTSRLLNELASPRYGGTEVVRSWSLEEIWNARDAQLRGQFELPARAAASMRTDDAIFVAYGNRLAPQRCVKTEMRPASARAKAISVAGEAEALFGVEGVGIAVGTVADINGCLVNHGVAFGYNTISVREDGSRIDLVHRYWPIEYVRWDDVRQMFMTRVDPSTVAPGDLLVQDGPLGYAAAYEIPIVHGDGRWVIYAQHDYRPFAQEAALLPAFAVWARHAFSVRDWTKGSTAHGNAKFVGEMPAGVPLQNEKGLSAEAAMMLVLLRDLASSDTPVGIRPSGSKTDFLTNTSTAWQVWAELVLNAERASARIYLGTDGTLGTMGGAPGVDITPLFGVAITKVRGDLGCIERCFKSGVLEVWCALNFGDSSLTPTRTYLLPDADEDAWRAAIGTRRQAFYADVKAARENGFPITQDFINELAQQYDVMPPTLAQLDDEAPKPTVTLAPTDVAKVVTVNEARATAGLDPLATADGEFDPDGNLTVAAFAAKQAVAAAAASAPPEAAAAA